MTKCCLVDKCSECPLRVNKVCSHPNAVDALTIFSDRQYQGMGSKETVPDICPLREEPYWVELSWELKG